MRNKINLFAINIGRSLTIMLVAGLLVLAVSTESFAQRETTGSFRIVSNDSVIGLVPGQLARVVVFNGIDPAINQAREQGVPDSGLIGGAKPHVKVFSWNGNILLSSTATIAYPGEFRTFDIKYADLEGLDTDPETGLREFRVELTIEFTGLESDAKKIRPILKSLDGGKTWTLIQLVPAIQKIR